jgi:hypothetical protein
LQSYQSEVSYGSNKALTTTSQSQSSSSFSKLMRKTLARGSGASPPGSTSLPARKAPEPADVVIESYEWIVPGSKDSLEPLTPERIRQVEGKLRSWVQLRRTLQTMDGRIRGSADADREVTAEQAKSLLEEIADDVDGRYLSRLSLQFIKQKDINNSCKPAEQQLKTINAHTSHSPPTHLATNLSPLSPLNY